MRSPGTPDLLPARSHLRPSWGRFAAQAIQDLALFLLAVVALHALRWTLIWTFRANLAAQTGLPALLRAQLRGLGFDARVAFYVTAPSLALTLACAFLPLETAARRVRLAAGGLFLGLLPLVGAVSIEYVREYGDLFNHFVLGVVYDDLGAVLTMIWQQYPVVWEVGLSLAAGLALVWALGRWLAWFRGAQAALRLAPRSRAARALLTATFAAVLVFSARGGFGRVPLQYRDRDVTTDEFLNRLVLNPISALRYAVKEHLHMVSEAGASTALGPRGIRGALEDLFPGRPLGSNLDDLFLRTAPGPTGPAPRHIFLLVMESYDAWPLIEPYRELHLLEQCERLGAQGILIPSFLSASSGTGTSLSALITGLHEVGVVTNYQPRSREAYPTAIAAIFRRLGYRTRLFYGGYLSWERLGDFARAQGFDETYGREHIPNPREVNEWGVDDASLFDLVLRTAQADDAPSFNLVMTTTNHPPYNFDLAGQGWAPRTLPPDLRSLASGRLTDNMMGHLWLSDRSMGQFVDKASRALARPLFAVTGDHFSRKFLNSRPSLFEGSAVPLLLYGPDALPPGAAPKRLAGSHMDLAATLVDLAAPAGFVYPSLGEDILDSNREPVGFGRHTIIGPDFIAPLDSDAGPEPLPWVRGPAGPVHLARLRARYRDLLGVSWWRIMKGPEIPPAPASPTLSASRPGP